MKKVILAIFREIGITLIMLVVLCAVIVVTFRNQLPFDDVIRQGEEYAKVNLKEFSISSSDRTNGIVAVTVTHEANANQIVEAENDIRIQTGKYTPFGTISNRSDLPTEKVNGNANSEINDVDMNQDAGMHNDFIDDRNSNGPIGSELIDQIDRDQAEDSSSAANRRLENDG